jgi:hypothetical protein
MPILKVTRSEALSRAEFHARLRRWLKSSTENIIGDPAVQGRVPWLHVRDNGRLFRLHADTPRHAVESYLKLADQLGQEVEWTVVPNSRGNLSAVAFGPANERVQSLYFYLCA